MNRGRESRAAWAVRMSGPGRYEGRRLPKPDEEVVDQGLAFDLETVLDRRGMLRLVGLTGLSAAGVLALVGCGSSGSAPASEGASAVAATTSGSGTATSCSLIPEETAGPYPGDGSNGPDVLSESGVVRSDIRSSFGDFSGTAEGVPMTIRLAIQDASNGCSAFAGAAVYAWHCDREGRYSLYSEGATEQNYLRGVQEADGDGVVTFTSIFPGCYAGRWPHVHFEVYPSLDAATDDLNAVATSQVALPEDVCNAVYATSGYEPSVSNLQQVSLATDNVFGDDGGASQLATASGGIDEGFVVELAVPVEAR